MSAPLPPSAHHTNHRNSTVVLFGEVLADIFPDRTVLGGAPFNVARHLQALGQSPVLITRLGHDDLREQVLDAMSKNGMETLGVQCSNMYPTGQVKVHLQGDTHRFEILPEQAYDYIHPGIVRMTTLSTNPALVYFGTLAQRSGISSRALKNLLRSTGAKRFLDINLRAPWYDEKTLRLSLQYANILKLNTDELGVLTEMFNLSAATPQERAKELISRFDFEQVVVTCGENGAWQINRNGNLVESAINDKPGKLVDTVGAGDGFAAVFMLGSLRRWPMLKTLERANAFAASICGIRGAIPNHADFYTPFIKEWGL